jgi:hypothetical protein
MNWETMDKKEARDFYQRLASDKAFLQELMVSKSGLDLREPYLSIRNRLKHRFSEAKDSSRDPGRRTRSPEYSIDLDMAEEIYRVMSEYGLSVRDAADEKVWIYLSVKVIPDIIIERFRTTSGSIPHEDRFYANPRRVYPSMLWWYFHLSYQEDDPEPMAATREVLIGNQSDDISQLVERAGSGGYPVKLYRCIMTEYARRIVSGCRSDGLLSRALKLNIVQMQSLEPELMFDGLDSYVSELFDRVVA